MRKRRRREETKSIYRTPFSNGLSDVSTLFASGVLIVTSSQAAMALNLYDGSTQGNNLEVNLTTTVSYSPIWRVNSPSAVLEGPGNANGNDGDSNFQHGLVSNLFEALPVLDIRDGEYGAHFSGQFYLNTSYLGTNQNGQASTLNSLYVNKSNDFSSATRNVNGENAQLLDAFVYGEHHFGDDQIVELKVGRQTLFWGQSLFFPSDGISGGQAPIDIITAQDLPNAQAQQVYLPVGQAVFTYQPGVHGLTFQAYYQFQWQHDYFQGAGAYFNPADYIDRGGQSIIAGATPAGENEYLLRKGDLNSPNGNGQFGASVQAEWNEVDLGLFAERFDAKAPEVYSFPGEGFGPISTNVAKGLAVGMYQVVYPRDIWLQGVSFSTNVGASNIGGELSVRERMPLATGFGVSTPENPGNANSAPLYPLGNTLDGQLSLLYNSPGIPLDPGGVSFDGEIVMNHVISVTANRDALTPGLQATAGALQFVVTPTYYNVLPKLQITFPIGISYDYLGRSEMDTSIYHGNGTFNIGVTATYNSTWVAALTYQDYLGRPDPVNNGLADRGYISLNLQDSF
jgi:hypothetical protein